MRGYFASSEPRLQRLPAMCVCTSGGHGWCAGCCCDLHNNLLRRHLDRSLGALRLHCSLVCYLDRSLGVVGPWCVWRAIVLEEIFPLHMICPTRMQAIWKFRHPIKSEQRNAKKKKNIFWCNTPPGLFLETRRCCNMVIRDSAGRRFSIPNATNGLR